MSPTPIITRHKANDDTHTHPPNTLEAIRACLDAGAAWIEIDIVALAEGDYLVIHDETLDQETSGSGPTNTCDVVTARTLTIKDHPSYRVPLLSDVVALLAKHAHKARLQLDFKSVYPFPTDEPLQRLLTLIAPIHAQVQVSSGADWQLRKLRRMDTALEIGLEIDFYLAVRDPNRAYDPRVPPFREGAYGYHDDSLLALAQVWPVADYLLDRCTMLMSQVAGISTLYINHRLLVRSLDEGFNWMDAAHAAGIKVCAWTLDVGNPIAEDNARRLTAAGVDRITSNTPQALARLLADE